jgi:hypothetical protein
MQSTKGFFVLAILVCFFGCWSSEKQNGFLNDSIREIEEESDIESIQKRNSIDTVEHLDFHLLIQFLGNEVDLIKSIIFTEGYVTIDTIFEDDGLEWPGLVLTKTGKQVVMMETSWENTRQIAIISIHSNEILTPDSITVGSKFGDIKERISPSIPSMPDGVFAVRSQKHPSVLLFLEPINQKMYFGNITFKEIPSTCKVSYIMLK